MLPQYPLAVSTIACSPSTFTKPDLFGAEILSLTAETVSNYTRTVPEEWSFHHPATSVSDASFCNVTVGYTHPGQGDLIYVETWLPLENWNERLQAVGGGGWRAGRFILTELLMTVAISDGYATVTTDAGLGRSNTPKDWALVSPGNANLYAIQNFASVSLNDEAVIAKSLIRDFYSKPPKYSYWSGCSQGGRQGLMLAQRYPDAYDGIVASAPVINLSELLMSAYWPQFFMDQIGYYPHPCEFTYLAEAAVKACDGLDGVIDGVISEPEACDFDPFSVVGNEIECPDEPDIRLSKEAAMITNATWSGARSSDGRPLWYGLGYAADLPGGVAFTRCENGTCTGDPTKLSTEFIRLFLEKDQSFKVGNISRQQFDRYWHRGVWDYTSAFGTNDPDLSEFRAAGGKLLTFHGLEDQVIPPQGTSQYHQSVASLFPDIDHFYRHFEIPGLGHCSGGNNANPTAGFELLRAWVEDGTEPEEVLVSFEDRNGRHFDRLLCSFPQRARYKGGDPTKTSSFGCEK